MPGEDTEIDTGAIDTSAEDAMSSEATSTTGTETAEALDGTAGGDERSATGEASGDATHSQASEAGARKQPNTDNATNVIPNARKARAAKAANTGTEPVNWQKTHQDAQAAWGRKQQEMERQTQQYQQQLQHFQRQEQQRQQEAAKLQLKRWDPGHPQYGDFRTLQGKIKGLQSQAAQIRSRTDIEPAAKEALLQNLTREIAPEEMKEMQEHEKMREEFLTNPVGSIQAAIRSAVPGIIAQQFQALQTRQKAEQEVNAILSDQQFVAKHGAELKQRLGAGQNYDFVLNDIRWREKFEAVEAKVKAAAGNQDQVTREAKANQERQRLAKGNAQITRDPKTTGVVDVYALALKKAADKGITNTDSPQFRKLVRDLEAANQS